MLANANLVDSATVIGVLISLSPIFQIAKMVRSGSSRNVSALYALSLDAGFAFFFTYSLEIGNGVFTISYAVALSVGVVNLCTILWLRRRPRNEAVARAAAGHSAPPRRPATRSRSGAWPQQTRSEAESATS